MYSLHRFLADYDMAMLRALALSRGIELSTNRQTEASDRLAIALLDPLSVRVALAGLSAGAREALDALLTSGGRMRTPQFARRFGQVRAVGPGRLEREAPWQNPANPVEELLYQGLIYRGFDRDEAGPGEFFFVPADLLPLLPQPAAAPPGFQVEVVPAPRQERDGGPALVHDLFIYLAHLYVHDVRPYADGRLGRRDLAELRRRMDDPDERRLAFLRHLAAGQQFAVQQGEFLRLGAAAVKRWLAASLPAQLAALQRAWRDDPSWNDLRHVPGLVFEEETGWQLRNDPLATRQLLLAMLAQCPKSDWWSLASFVAGVKQTQPDFQRPDGDYTGWYVRDASGGSYFSGFESWDRVEGALLTDLLTGPLSWLGVVATGSSEAGPACRLTESGARLLGLAEEEAEVSPSPPILVGTHLRVQVPPPINFYTCFQLERFGELETEEPWRYRLSADSLGRGLARGLRVEQILAFLQQASGGTVPPNVAGQLRLWAGRFDSVRLEEAALLRTRDERVLKELSVLPETRALIGQVLTPTTAVVRKSDLPRLRRELGLLGYLRESSEGETKGSAAE